MALLVVQAFHCVVSLITPHCSKGTEQKNVQVVILIVVVIFCGFTFVNYQKSHHLAFF